MKHFDLPLKIGVIDDEIEPQVLKMLVPYYSGEVSIIQCNRMGPIQAMATTKVNLPVNHSTLCTALLIEGLHKENILDKVKITNISIESGFGEKRLQGLISALDYCNRHTFDILSVSVGVLNLLYAKQMLPLLQQIKKTLIVSAASNDFSLTYPAAFSAVIGVKRAVHKIKKRIEVVKDPVDGIELIRMYSETPILCRLNREYQLNYEDSNSILVPQVCAEVACHVLQNNMELTKNSVLCTFAKLSGLRGTDHKKDYYFNKESDNSVPVVLFRYDRAKQKDSYDLLKRLQGIFEDRGYSCAILCDFIKDSDFENGWYRVCSKNIEQEVEYYLNVTSDSILFLLLSNETTESFNYDMSISEEALSYSLNEQEMDKLFIKIVVALS